MPTQSMQTSPEPKGHIAPLHRCPEVQEQRVARAEEAECQAHLIKL